MVAALIAQAASLFEVLVGVAGLQRDEEIVEILLPIYTLQVFPP